MKQEQCTHALFDGILKVEAAKTRVLARDVIKSSHSQDENLMLTYEAI